MKKVIWSEDPMVIKQEIDSLAATKTDLVCGRRGRQDVKKLGTAGKTQTKAGSVFVLHHPHDPTCASDTCTFYYHDRGKQLRFFETKRLRKAEKFMGFEYPARIYIVHRRKYERVTAHNNSPVTFSFRMRHRIFHGTIGDISSHGAKFLVNIPREVATGEILCHITLNLLYRVSKAKTVIVVEEAKVVWCAYENETTTKIGVEFIFSLDELTALSNYVELRLIEESSNLLAARPTDTVPATPEAIPVKSVAPPEIEFLPEEEIPEF